MYKPDEIETKEVSTIIIDYDRIGVSYYVRPYDGAPEEATLFKANVPHEDFSSAFKPIQKIARKWLETTLINAEGQDLGFRVDKIKFVESAKKGRGVKIFGHIYGLTYSEGTIKIATPTYYVDGNGMGKLQNGEDVDMEMISQDDWRYLVNFRHEAFLYAYYNKCQQPTIEEAAEAELNGGFKDEEE